MIEAAINRILKLARPELVTAANREYATCQLSPVLDPTPATLTIHTLTGLAAYLHENRDCLDHNQLMVHIVGPEKIVVYSTLHGDFQQRSAFIQVQTSGDTFPFDKFIDQERFIIALQTLFVQGETTAKILKLVGNLTDELVKSFGDDGVSQMVTARTGIAKVENVLVPNPVTLAPYRTFREVAQPKSPFVLRMKQGRELPEIALYEADGGKWKLDAIKLVEQWLKVELPAGITILA